LSGHELCREKNGKLVFPDNEGNYFKWSLTALLSIMCRTLEYAFWQANALANLSSELVPSLASSLPWQEWQG